MKKLLILVLVVILFGSMGSFAQEDELDEDDIDEIEEIDDEEDITTTDNWCYEGQPWAGQCDVPDEALSNYMWIAGWCYAQSQLGYYDESGAECIAEIYESPDDELDEEVDGEDYD